MSLKRRRRVAFLSEHASPLALLGSEDSGGQNVYVDEVSRNLVASGYEVDVFVRRDDAALDEIVAWAPGVRVIHLDAGPAAFLLKDALWEHMPEFRDAFVRFAQNQQERYELIHGNFWMSGWVAATAGDRLGIPVVQIFHAMGATKRREQGAADTSPPERLAVERDVIRRVDRIIAQCPAEQIELIEDYGADPAKVAVIPSGVNVELFHSVDQSEARRRCGLPEDEFIVVYVGRMLPRKDPRNIVRALAKLIERTAAPLRLLLVGGEDADPDPDLTPEIGELRRVGEELGILAHMTFTGKRQPAELRFFYGAGDVAVTTPWYEPFGLTPLEAMACGRPVVGSSVGGINFTVQDGRAGFLVPPRDPGALAERLHYLLEHPDERQRMGRQARRRIEREFTWNVVARRTAGLYGELCAKHAADNTMALHGTNATQ